MRENHLFWVALTIALFGFILKMMANLTALGVLNLIRPEAILDVYFVSIGALFVGAVMMHFLVRKKFHSSPPTPLRNGLKLVP